MTPSEKVASRQADFFVSVFGSIIDGSSEPVLVSGAGQQMNFDGVAFKGGNSLLASLVSKMNGYGIPHWLSMGRKDDLGLMIRQGERSIPVVHYDVYYVKTDTGKRDPAMNDAAYKALSDEDKEKWQKRSYMKMYPEFNIAQTNFDEMYPQQWDELVAMYGNSRKVLMECPILDVIIASGDAFGCEIVSGDRFSYNEGWDRVTVPSKDIYPDQGRYYGDFLYTLARSTGSEGRLDRNIASGDLDVYAREELVCELAAATLGTLAGVQVSLQDHNLANLKSWVNAIQADPTVIYKAVNDAAKAADMVSNGVGLVICDGFNIEKLMSDVEKAQQARKENMERRAKRAEKVRKSHRKGWSPVKTGKAAGRKVK